MEAKSVASAVATWLAEGQRVAVANPVEFAGFSSRRPAEMLAVSASGQRAGQVLGAFTSEALAEQLADLLEPGRPPGRLVRLPVSAAAAAEAGLACGGTVTVALHDAGALPGGFWSTVVEGRPVALVSAAESGGPLSSSLTVSDGDVAGTLCDPDVKDEAIAAGQDLLARARPGGSLVQAHGTTLVVEAIVPAVQLVVVGRGDLASALIQQGELLTWQVKAFDDVTSATAAIAASGPRDAVVVLSHDPALDAPALEAALASRAGYVGALGSRRTQTARRDRLLGRGVAEAALGRIHGPAGLDLGSRTPEEIALAICAEVLAICSARAGTSLRDRQAPINA
jgi:xanthine dehydrogenase accessory factor